MFGKDYKPHVVDAIYKAIESEKKVLEVFKKEILKKVEKDKTVMIPFPHMIYFDLNRASQQVQNASSREMYQALNSVASNCKYDGEKDQCSGTIGDFTLSLSREKDSYGTYVVISAMPSMSTISQITNQVIADQKTQSNISINKSDKSLPLAEIKVITMENVDKKEVENLISKDGKFCTKCSTENANEAKFCKSCGSSLTEKEPLASPEQAVIKAELIQEQVSAVNTENKPFIAEYWHWIIGIAIVVFVPIIMVPMTDKHTDTATAPTEYSAEVDAAAPAADYAVEAVAPAAEAAADYATDAVAPAATPVDSYMPSPHLNEEEAAAPVETERPMTAEEACNNGDSDKCGQVGIMYHEGQGVDKSYSKAMKFLQKACDGGNSNGCKNLGIMYSLGEGVDEDSAKAAKLLRKACFTGSASGCAALGSVYKWGGNGLDKDMTKAAEYYKKGCDGGNTNACSDYKELQSQGY